MVKKFRETLDPLDFHVELTDRADEGLIRERPTSDHEKKLLELDWLEENCRNGAWKR